MPAFGAEVSTREVYLEWRLEEALRDTRRARAERDSVVRKLQATEKEKVMTETKTREDLLKVSSRILAGLAAYHAALSRLATLMFIEAADGRTISVTVEGEETTWNSADLNVDRLIRSREDMAEQFADIMNMLIAEGTVTMADVEERGVQQALEGALVRVTLEIIG